jgi:hypothetical protein
VRLDPPPPRESSCRTGIVIPSAMQVLSNRCETEQTATDRDWMIEAGSEKARSPSRGSLGETRHPGEGESRVLSHAASTMPCVSGTARKGNRRRTGRCNQPGRQTYDQQAVMIAGECLRLSAALWYEVGVGVVKTAVWASRQSLLDGFELKSLNEA